MKVRAILGVRLCGHLSAVTRGPRRCGGTATHVGFAPKGAAQRCWHHANVATHILAKGSIRYRSCRLPREVDS